MWNFPCFMLLFRFIPLFLLSTWTYLHALVFNNQITVISFLFSAQSRPHPLFLSSQPHPSPDCWFEGLVCEKGLCEFLCGLSDLIFSQYLWHSDLLWDQKINKHLTFYNKGPLRFLPKQKQFSYPDCFDLRAILKEVPDTWPEFIPRISDLFEHGQGGECAVCLKQKKRKIIFNNPVISPHPDWKHTHWASSFHSEPIQTWKYFTSEHFS